MTIPTPRPEIYTIPADTPFASALVAGLMAEVAETPEALPKYTILLPTRRACRTVREAFLQFSQGRPLLLPRLQPLGDVDDEELSIFLSAENSALDIPPAIPPLQRQMLLARLIGHLPQFTRGMAQDVRLARTLGQLMDQMYIEDLSFADLPALIDREAFANHWQITLDFLSILSEHWPRVLAEQGVIDGADRRNRLIRALAAQWERTPPPHPVIAAGSTGSIPATARLLGVIARMPGGRVVLPGLDRHIDDEGWFLVDDTHPQATLKTLLHKLDCARTEVRPWFSNTETTSAPQIRSLLASEIMRPAGTTERWRDLTNDAASQAKMKTALRALHRYDCATPQEEALVIATALRETLQQKDKTAALITPDRQLARRVAMACRRWGIELDDSAGQKLGETAAGTFLRLVAGAVTDNVSPVSLLALLKHDRCRPDNYPGSWKKDVSLADRHLRGPAVKKGLRGLAYKFNGVPELNDLCQYLETIFTPLLTLSHDGHNDLNLYLEAHLTLAENLCPPDFLWTGEDGEQAATFLAELRDTAATIPIADLTEYAAILEILMADVSVRPSYGRHPRLRILGQLEARLTQADRIIMGGLNEGTWPPAPAADPWMSRPMRRNFGLPGPDRSIGQSAHDFVQGFCAPEVILTRAARVNGTPTVPARFLSRLSTVLEGLGIQPDSLSQGPHRHWAAHMEDVQDVQPVVRPAPVPPVEARPRRLSVTKIETLLNDPYSIYARYILKLQPLEPLDAPVDAALKGTLLHDILAEFARESKDTLPPGTQDRFLTLASEKLKTYADDPGLWNFWQPRLSRLAKWLYDHEVSWRTRWKILDVETVGQIGFEGPYGPFTLTARADRIDVSRDGKEAAIIDYKSGGQYSKKGMQNGQHPQLPLEALMLEQGGFGALPPLPVTTLAYWVLSGGRKSGDRTELDSGISTAIENARDGLENLIAVFDDPATAYFSLPDLSRAPRFNDYEHLARVKEWTALGEGEEAA